MYRMQLAAVLAASAGLGGWWEPAGTAEAAQAIAQAAMPDAPAEAPPAAWLQGDPADSLYRAAREALNRRDYDQAAELFAALPDRFPRSGYAPDAYYWRAFALYRLGGEQRHASTAARRLLGTNRMLLDSPAAVDRRTRLLLEDLELVLAGIAQLPDRARPEDLNLINQGMETGQVMPRLRTAVPAGAASRQGAL